MNKNNLENAIKVMREKYGDDHPALNKLIKKFANNDLDFLNMSHEPVSIETFIHDPYFMGKILDEVWDTTVESVKEVINGGYVEAVFDGSIGRAKCFAKGTKVIKYDGNIVNVEDINIGDLLLAPDSGYRKVTSLANGRERLYKIKQSDNNDYIVNESHILSLKDAYGNIINISVLDYLSLPAKPRHDLKGWKPDIIEFPETRFEPLSFDPYSFGLFLVSGDDENAYIPHEYKVSGESNRLELLGAIVDSYKSLIDDNNCYVRLKIDSVLNRIIDDVSFIARSLGFNTIISEDCLIIRGDVRYIPTTKGDGNIGASLCHNNFNTWDIEVEPLDVGEYYGFTLEGKDRLFLLDDFTVVHNTTRATIVAAYNLYTLSCHNNPQKALGLMANSDIYIVMINKNETLARKVTYAKFRKLIESIPYFQDHFMFDKNVDSEMRFPNNIFVIYSNADNDKLLGMDVVSGLVGEINFYAVTEKSKRSRTGGTYDQAMVIYNGLIRRIQSRMEGLDVKVKGCISVVSSRAYLGDFTDTKIKQIEEDKKAGKKITTYVSTGSFWSFVPQYRKDGSQRFADERFYVAIGDKQNRTEIIPTDTDNKGRMVISVPVNFKDDFERDIEGALRDLAGMVSGSTGSYFSAPEIIWNAVNAFNENRLQTLFDVEQWDLEDGLPPINTRFLLPNARINRFVHLDLSLSSDKTGIAIGHSVTDHKPVTPLTQKSYDFERAPIVTYDGFLAIKPPSIGEISYSKIRRLIYYLMDELKFKIKYVSADSFQSSDMLQVLSEKRGIETVKISVEKEDHYKAVKNAFDEERILLPHHEIMIDELLHVVKDDKGNIDHLPTTCFTGDVEIILANGDFIRFDEMIKPYYEVITYHETRFVKSIAINRGITGFVNKLMLIELEDGSSFRCTLNHRVMLINGEWVKARDLKVNDKLKSLLASKVTSVNQLKLVNKTPVYDITVPETENFCLSSGAVVHNSKDVSDAMVGVYANILRIYKTGELYNSTASHLMGLYTHNSRRRGIRQR